MQLPCDSNFGSPKTFFGHAPPMPPAAELSRAGSQLA